jgi:hypothetical protein
MRFMMLMYPGPQAETETGPGNADPALIEAMMAFNQRMIDAGIMLGGDGLHPTRTGARVQFQSAGKSVVTDGPFTEIKEVLGGYWMIEVKSLAEAVEWAGQAPCPAGEMIEIRKVYEPEDFGPAVAEVEHRQIDQMKGQRKP